MFNNDFDQYLIIILIRHKNVIKTRMHIFFSFFNLKGLKITTTLIVFQLKFLSISSTKK